MAWKRALLEKLDGASGKEGRYKIRLIDSPLPATANRQGAAALVIAVRSDLAHKVTPANDFMDLSALLRNIVIPGRSPSL